MGLRNSDAEADFLDATPKMIRNKLLGKKVIK